MQFSSNNKKHLLEHPVRWGDMDALEHVNNTIYFRYFEEARINFFNDSGLRKLMDSQNVGFILGSTDCKFKFPITYPDTLYIESVALNVENDRFTVRQTIKSKQHEKIAAESSSVIVSYDHKNKRKATLPELVIELLK